MEVQTAIDVHRARDAARSEVIAGHHADEIDREELRMNMTSPVRPAISISVESPVDVFRVLVSPSVGASMMWSGDWIEAPRFAPRESPSTKGCPRSESRLSPRQGDMDQGRDPDVQSGREARPEQIPLEHRIIVEDGILPARPIAQPS